MLKVAAACVLALGLAGCVSPQQQAANDARECQAMGAKPGTDIFVQCQMFKQQQRAADNQARSRNLALAAAMLNPPQPARVQMNCTSSRFGSDITTTCY